MVLPGNEQSLNGIKPLRTDQKEKFGLFFCFNRGKVMQNANKFAYIKKKSYLCADRAAIIVRGICRDKKIAQIEKDKLL